MNKKILVIGIIGLVVILSVSGLGYVYMSGTMVAPDNEYYSSSELEEETQQEEEEPEPTNQEPIASLSASKTSGEVPLTVKFTGSGYDTDGYISSYYWAFGDGHTSNIQNPTHTFESEGTYTIVLTVTDNDRGTASNSLTITVEEETKNDEPEATITASKTIGEVPLKIDFTGYGTDLDGTIESYTWNFGDGESSDEQNPTHTFNEEGSYTVTLTVTDNNGGIGTDTIVIEALERTEITLNPTDDATVDSDEPDLNLGNDGSLRTWYYHSEYYTHIFESFLKFDIAEIPTDVTIKRVTLKLYAYWVGSPATITVHRCSDNSWDESTITWNNAPSYTTESEDNEYINSDDKWLEWDVSDYFTDTLPYNRMVSFVLRTRDGTVAFNSKEISWGEKPVLEIDWE